MKELCVTENFKNIIDKNAYYVDKTQLIVDCIKEKCALYTRPRRFGKSLNMSMLYYFFSNKEKDNAYLFDGLKVTNYPEVMKHQNQYPTLFITLKDLRRQTMSMQKDKFAALIASIVTKYPELLLSEKLDEDEKDLLLQYRKKKSSESDLRDALLNLSTYLQKHFNQKVIILIDEYDVPLQAAYQNGYYEEMVGFLRDVFSSALKSNDYLEKGILTGCLRISKESIFTGLNNFNVYSILEGDNEESFGFTESEVKQMLEDYHISECFGEVKEWYDGYIFGDKEIYNPWSTIKYVKMKVKNLNSFSQTFWANTSGNDIVYGYIQDASPKLREEFEKLMNGDTIVKEIIPDLTYREMDDIDNIYSFLLMTGYLKVVQKIDDEYELIIPNREVYEIYRTKFKKYFGNYKKMRKSELYKAFVEEDTEQADELLNDILSKNISYYDNKEDFYHGYLVGLFADDYNVESNKESGDGRFDLKLTPKVGKSNIVILIECKHSRNEDNLKMDASKGAKQIVEKNYKRDIQSADKKVIGYGISFYKKKCRVVKAEIC